MDPLTGFVAIIDKLIAWLKERRDDRRQLFTQFIQPLHEQFQPVARDYVDLFVRFGEEAAGAHDLDGLNRAFVEFSKGRQVMETSRRQIEILAETYALKLGKDDIEKFFLELCSFFYGPGQGDSLSEMLRQQLALKIRRRQEIQKEMDAASFSTLNRPMDPLGSRIPGLGHFPGLGQSSGLGHSIDETIQRQVAAEKLERLRREDQEMKAACVKEATALTELSRDRWKVITRLFAELRLKYAA